MWFSFVEFLPHTVQQWEKWLPIFHFAPSFKKTSSYSLYSIYFFSCQQSTKFPSFVLHSCLQQTLLSWWREQKIFLNFQIIFFWQNAFINSNVNWWHLKMHFSSRQFMIYERFTAEDMQSNYYYVFSLAIQWNYNFAIRLSASWYSYVAFE